MRDEPLPERLRITGCFEILFHAIGIFSQHNFAIYLTESVNLDKPWKLKTDSNSEV
jgi:hypothetical protein